MFLKFLLLSFHGVIEVFAIGILGYLIVNGLTRKGEAYMDVLSKLVIRLTLPCLIIVNILTKFNPASTPLWWAYPLIALILPVCGVMLGGLYSAVDRTIPVRGDFMALTGFQNGIFLPLAFAPVLFSGEELSQFLNLLFLFNITGLAIFFSLAVWLVNSQESPKNRVMSIVNPPVVTTSICLALLPFGVGEVLPEWLLRPISSVGNMTSTLASLFVGGIIATSLKASRAGEWPVPIKAAAIKCLALPAVAVLFVWLAQPPQHVGLFVIMESAMPSALTIALVLPDDSMRRRVVAGAILMSSLMSIVTIPLFMGVYGLFYG